MKIAAFNVGPSSNVYSGKHTYHDVWIPFLNELARRQNVSVDWIGITLENRHHNENLEALGISLEQSDVIAFSDSIKNVTNSVTWDFVNPAEYDALLCQPRPAGLCDIENEILIRLIRKFVAMGKKIFVWECDLFTDVLPAELREQSILLYPTILPPTQRFKKEYYFPFFTHSEYADSEKTDAHDRDLDFLLIANIYGRNAQAEQFFGPMQEAPFRKTVFGSWIETKERQKFSSRFKNFEFMGNSEFWAANKLMKRAKATLHIVPDFARDRGLMTARVFTSQMSRSLCFCDAGIVGAEKFFPKELIVENGEQIVERWAQVQEHREELLVERDRLLKEHTVENRVSQFIELLNEQRGIASL